MRVNFVIFAFFVFCKFVFPFCDIIPQSIEEARELLSDEIIDDDCFNAAQALFLNPVDPLSEGWQRLEDIGFDLAMDEIPTSRELIASGGEIQKLFRKYPLISQYENFIFIPQRSLGKSPIKSTLSVFARRTDGDDEQYFSVSSATKIEEKLLVSAQVRERKSEQYLENRSILYNFGNKKFSGFFNVGNLTSPSNELLFGRYATFLQAQGKNNLYYGSSGGYNGIITQIATQNLGASGYFHIKEEEQMFGGGVFVQPKDFRLETIIIRAQKGENEENLLQIRGNFTKLGLSVSNAMSLSSIKNATLVRFEKSARNARIISQTYLLQEGFNSPFSYLIARNDTLQKQKFGSQLSLSGRSNTQKFSLSTRYLLNGDFGTANIVGSYYFPEITGFGLRSNFTIKTDSTKLRQSHTVFNQKKIGKIFKTNASLANSYDKDGWRHSIFNLGINSFLPYNQQIYFGYSQRIRNEKSSRETICFSYKSASQSKNTRSLSMDIPLYETAKGLKFYGEMRFAFPVFDNNRL
ncbi:MAG: hypothetical protein FWF51_07765 [Chitinivibrionia bacterium]|nr:hypothetical protein [Chitinivibrionia bacterium]